LEEGSKAAEREEEARAIEAEHNIRMAIASFIQQLACSFSGFGDNFGMQLWCNSVFAQ
jgi:hypothetical protein